MHSRHTQSIQNNKFKIYLRYFKENVKDDLDFLPADKRQRFLQSDIIILGVCGQASQIIQNYKFATYLHYVKKDVSDKAKFLHADKHESFLQIDTFQSQRHI